MSAHTPGPWQMSYDNGSGRDIVASPDPLPICNVRISYVGTEQYHANARLIAAAPELFDALKAAVELIEVLSPVEGDTIRCARAALAKVRS